MIDIFRFFHLSKSSQSYLPSICDWEECYNLKTTSAKKWSALISTSTKCIDQLLNTLCPGPSQAELRKVVARRIQKTLNCTENVNHKKVINCMLQTIFSCLKVSKKGSIEQTRSKVSDDSVRTIVAFILHRDHVVQTAWGKQTFKLSNHESVTLPRLLCRKRLHLDLWNSYISSTCNLDENYTILIGKRSFYYIVNDLTTSNKVVINAVDYVQALLVTEPIKVLQDMVDSMIHTSKRDKMTKYLKATATFLKYRFNYHV